MAKVWGPYGDNINTDLLFPGKYTYLGTKPEDIIPHLLEDLDPEFAKNVKPGDIIIAGKNFGCGSRRNQPAIGFKALNMIIIAKSFARIFYRASINLGLPLIIAPDAVDAYKKGDIVNVDLEKAIVQINDKTFKFKPFDPFVMDIIKNGGLLNILRKKYQNL